MPMRVPQFCSVAHLHQKHAQLCHTRHHDTGDYNSEHENLKQAKTAKNYFNDGQSWQLTSIKYFSASLPAQK